MDTLFQNLYDIISSTLPDAWDKLVIHAVFDDEEACDINYFTRQKGKEFHDCFSLDLDKTTLLSTLHSLYEAIAVVRNSLPKQDRWNDITVIVDAEGNFNVEYAYESVLIFDEDSQRTWAEKYLR